jgi:Tol biopolymer transport system component
MWWIAADASSAEELPSPPSLYNNAEGWPIAPDGRKMVYGATVDGHSQLFESDLSTRQAKQLTFSSDDKFNAAWSPDGRWLVYASNANGSNQPYEVTALLGKGGMGEVYRARARKLDRDVAIKVLPESVARTAG